MIALGPIPWKVQVKSNVFFTTTAEWMFTGIAPGPLSMFCARTGVWGD